MTRQGTRVVLVLSVAVLVIVIDARDVGRSGWRAVGISRRRRGTDVLLASGGPPKARITRKGSALSVKDRLRKRPGREPTGLLPPRYESGLGASPPVSFRHATTAAWARAHRSPCPCGVTAISRWARIAPPEILPPVHRTRRDRIGWLRGCLIFHDARSNQGHQHSSTYTSVIHMLKLC
jgi:hypothetical protein